MKKHIAKCFLFITILVISFYSTPGKSFSQTLFKEEFNGMGELHQYNNFWTCSDPFNNDSCSGLSGGINVNNDHAITTSYDPAYIYTGIEANNNICTSIDYNWSTGGSWTALLLHAKDNNASIRVYIEQPGRIPGKTWVIYTNNLSQEYYGLLDFDINLTHKLKACLNGNVLDAYLDNNLFFSKQISDLSSDPYVGFATQYPTNYIDNFTIEKSTQVYKVLDLPYLLQSSDPWSKSIYDSANKWSPLKPYIKNWGCALTSAAMIFKYYGINKLPDGTNLNPGSLNDWLKAQKDGYLNGGNLNWIALTRLSKQVKNINNLSFDALTFSRIDKYDPKLLTDDINNNQPDIASETGHFIVIKGINNDTFDINDPAYTNRKTLKEGYNNYFYGLRRFIPSHTDLSYILITGNLNSKIQILSNSNEELGISSIDQIIDDENSNQSNYPIQNYYLSNPATGDYKINLSSGNHDLEQFKLYLYDINGNVKIIKPYGRYDSNGIYNFTIHYDKNNLNKIRIIRHHSCSYLVDVLNDLYNKNEINNKGILYSLVKKICNKDLKPFINELNSQTDKHISRNAHDILLWESNQDYND